MVVVETARQVLVAREPNTDREAEAHFATNGLKDLQDETETVLDRAAVLVGAVIRQWREELGDEIPMGAV